MPLLRFDLIEGRREAEIKTHRAMLAAFTMPERDRYRHRAYAVANDREDTGLGIPRTYTIVFLQVTSHERSKKQKEAFYRLLRGVQSILRYLTRRRGRGIRRER